MIEKNTAENHDVGGMTTRGKKRQRTGKGFSPNSESTLDSLVEGKLPRGANEWIEVTKRYNEICGDNRNFTSLKQKFYRLANTKKPTGGTEIPIIVLRAKRAMERIELSGSVATFGIK